MTTTTTTRRTYRYRLTDKNGATHLTTRRANATQAADDARRLVPLVCAGVERATLETFDRRVGEWCELLIVPRGAEPAVARLQAAVR